MDDLAHLSVIDSSEYMLTLEKNEKIILKNQHCLVNDKLSQPLRPLDKNMT